MLKCSSTPSIVGSGVRPTNCSCCLLAFISPKAPICRVRCVYLRSQTANCNFAIELRLRASDSTGSGIPVAGRLWLIPASPGLSRVSRMTLERQSRPPVWCLMGTVYPICHDCDDQEYISSFHCISSTSHQCCLWLLSQVSCMKISALLRSYCYGVCIVGGATGHSVPI